jgi:hypothetical protein
LIGNVSLGGGIARGKEGTKGQEGQNGCQKDSQEGAPQLSKINRLDAATAKGQDETMSDDKRKPPERPQPSHPQERPRPSQDQIRKDSNTKIDRTTDWNKPPRKDND